MTYNAKYQDDFYNLFKGNTEAFGIDTDSGVRCVRGSAYDAIGRHLDGGPACGIYPMHSNMVKWGCTDIDNGSFADAQTMYGILDRMELHPWIELSRSKGYHVWVFAEESMPAWYMRRCFLFAHYVSEQIGQPVPPTEVNPKQEWLDDSQLGNFVRLPYVNGDADDNGRRIMVSHVDGQPVPLDEFLAVAEVVPKVRVRQWAEKYRPAPQQTYEWQSDASSTEAVELAQRLTGLGFVIWRDGPPEWNPRRSNTMAKLARECAIAGLSMDEAYVLVSDLDDRLGKWGREAPRRTCVEWGYNNV